MTKTRSSPFTPAQLALASLALGLGLAAAAPAWAQADEVVTAARAAGVVGEQADGYLGIVSGQSASADVRARVDQINIRRRAEYQARAERNNATVNEMAASTACVLFSSRIRVGEFYRDETGTWRQHTASAPVAQPTFCTG